MGRSYNIPLHFSELKIPEALVIEAGEASGNAIWGCAMEEVYMRTGIWNAAIHGSGMA